MKKNPLGDLVRNAVYFGIGLADLAQEQANENIQKLRSRAQALAEELVRRGEMNAEEARKFVDGVVKEAQQGRVNPDRPSRESEEPSQPRKIEIVSDDDSETNEGSTDVEGLRQEIDDLQEELRRLQQ